MLATLWRWDSLAGVVPKLLKFALKYLLVKGAAVNVDVEIGDPVG